MKPNFVLFFILKNIPSSLVIREWEERAGVRPSHCRSEGLRAVHQDPWARRRGLGWWASCGSCERQPHPRGKNMRENQAPKIERSSNKMVETSARISISTCGTTYRRPLYSIYLKNLLFITLCDFKFRLEQQTSSRVKNSAKADRADRMCLFSIIIGNQLFKARYFLGAMSTPKKIKKAS